MYSSCMDEIQGLLEGYKLKTVSRNTEVGDRHENDAEHTYSCLFISQFFLKKVSEQLDELKVFKLLLYHDLVEAYAGDVFTMHKKDDEKHDREVAAAKKLRGTLPKEIAEEFYACFMEYETKGTREALFARAIDGFDPIFNGWNQPDVWTKNNFTEEGLRAFKMPKLKAFPELVEYFEHLVLLLKEKGFI
jgi:putative hydrolase of HD superfamily